MGSVIINKEKERNLQEYFRYEFKYLLSRNIMQEIEAEVQNFMRYDGHVDPVLDNQYLVRSLYFETPSAENFHEKIDGIKTRRKYRLRTYSRVHNSDTPIFLEVKGRHNERTYKQRVELDISDLDIIYNMENITDLIDIYSGISLIESFVFDVYRCRLSPAVLIDYNRRPNVSDYDMYFRVTFDQKVDAVSSVALFPSDINSKFRSCVAGYSILEVKFNRRIPAWFHRIIQAHEMRRRSISKFVLGMTTCDLAEDLS